MQRQSGIAWVADAGHARTGAEHFESLRVQEERAGYPLPIASLREFGRLIFLHAG
jgi:hypothetical protein